MTSDTLSAAALRHVELIIAVPARLGSTRLPRKPLALIAGKPMVVRVAERVLQCALEIGKNLAIANERIICLVATDSSEIAEALRHLPIRVIMTDSALPSGTDRVMAAVERLPEVLSSPVDDETVIVNLQGDEPFFNFRDIEKLVSALRDEPHLPMGTLAFPQSDAQQFFRTSVVKVIRNAEGNASCFSRAPVPWPRELLGASDSLMDVREKVATIRAIDFLQHLGIYAFRRHSLRQFTQMRPSPLEIREGLEQLRALDAGWMIKVIEASEPPFGIDTADDLQRAEHHLSSKESV